MQPANAAKQLWDSINTSYENKWVAISPDYSRVLGSADKLSQLIKTVGQQDAVFHRVLPENVSFAPAAPGHEV